MAPVTKICKSISTIFMNSVYKINKGINRPIEFRGLKAQYIWFLGGGLVGLMIIFAIMYIIGISPYLCVGLILIAGAVLFMHVYRLSNTYGEHGMMKKMAKKGIPKTVKCTTRTVFISSLFKDRKDLLR
jgi:hypothetical protein